MAEKNHWFSIKLPEASLRVMNRAEYKMASSWLRLVRRRMVEEHGDEMFKDIDESMKNLAIYGCSHPEIYKKQQREQPYNIDVKDLPWE